MIEKFKERMGSIESDLIEAIKVELIKVENRPIDANHFMFKSYPDNGFIEWVNGLSLNDENEPIFLGTPEHEGEETTLLTAVSNEDFTAWDMIMLLEELIKTVYRL